MTKLSLFYQQLQFCTKILSPTPAYPGSLHANHMTNHCGTEAYSPSSQLLWWRMTNTIFSLNICIKHTNLQYKITLSVPAALEDKNNSGLCWYSRAVGIKIRVDAWIDVSKFTVLLTKVGCCSGCFSWESFDSDIYSNMVPQLSDKWQCQSIFPQKFNHGIFFSFQSGELINSDSTPGNISNVQQSIIFMCFYVLMGVA